tara:strand:- start:10793 stop:11671 length:879 start_codon:yes stop_codon:yes gene_type:complete
MKIKGSIPALITPFKNNKVDYDSFSRIIERSINEGSHGLVPCGTTGESPTLTHEEHKNVIEECIKVADKRVPVIAGTGSNSTDEAIDFTVHAEKAGADVALIVTPYYNKPTQDGLILHYKKITAATNIPIIIYNIPGRSIVDMEIDTMVELSNEKNIIGVKDATNDLMRPLLTRVNINREFNYLSGEDGTSVAYLAQGGDGCISVTANVAPKICSDIQNAWIDGNIKLVQELNQKLVRLHHALFVESSPGPVKYAASLLDLCSFETRLPLAPIKENTKVIVKNAMRFAGLIN